jgi:hypothetical protein
MSIDRPQYLRPARLADGLAIAAIFAIVASMQFVSGAYASDFASDADEPSHVVSSLLIRDYIAAGFPHGPMRFAEVYYVHYPKVAIGHWPPLMYALEAMWMLVFGRTRVAMLALVTMTALALLVSVYLWVRRDCGAIAGFLAAAALVTPGFMQVAMSSVEPNMFLALLAFWAAAAYGRYLETGRWRDAMWFGAIVLAAVGVHGRGAALALAPVIAALFPPAFNRQRRAWAWRGAALIAAIAAVVLAHRIFRQTFRPSLHAAAIHAGSYVARAFIAMSWPVASLAVVGGVLAVRFLPARWIAMFAAVLSCWIFHSVVNVPFEDRYLVTSAPAIAALFGAGIHFFTLRLASGTWRRAVAAVIVVVACVAIVRNVIPLWRKSDPGYHRLLASSVPPGIILVAGGPVQEGSFIAEIALRDRRPDHIVLRASKMLASSDWLDRWYHMLFSNSHDVSAYLDQLHVETVVIAEPQRRPHIGQLLEAVTGNPAVWNEAPSDQQDVRIFRRIGPVAAGVVHIRIPVNQRYFDLEW